MTLLSLVIPCYNEAENIPALLARCAQVFTNCSVEIILVNNGSTDHTQAILEQLLPRYTFAQSVLVKVNQGYGFGILSGLKQAKGDYVGWTHADLQTDPADVLMALGLIQESKELLFLKGKRYGRSILDLFFTVGMSVWSSLLLKTRLWDINAQPTIMPRSFFESWQEPPSDFSLDLYAYYLAKKEGFFVKRFPVFFGKRVAGEAHLNNLKAKIRYSIRTIKYSYLLRKKLLHE
ncbi:MAG: glycosyl transferase family 2 [Gammaproteobacteria bacterium]|nr:glycosyl transferase family 2 [Gammaproteobacteria bacterium]